MMEEIIVFQVNIGLKCYALLRIFGLYFTQMKDVNEKKVKT
jgi:hypothetical protein